MAVYQTTLAIQWLREALPLRYGASSYDDKTSSSVLQPLGMNGYIGLLVIMAGLIAYRFSHFFLNLYDRILGRAPRFGPEVLDDHQVCLLCLYLFKMMVRYRAFEQASNCHRRALNIFDAMTMSNDAALSAYCRLVTPNIINTPQVKSLLHQRGDQIDVSQYIWEGYTYHGQDQKKLRCVMAEPIHGY